MKYGFLTTLLLAGCVNLLSFEPKADGGAGGGRGSATGGASGNAGGGFDGSDGGGIGGGGIGGGSGGAGAAGGGSGGGTPSAFLEYCTERVNAQCAQISRCGNGQSMTDCVNFYYRNQCAPLDSSVASGRMTFSPTAAAQCLSLWKSATCLQRNFQPKVCSAAVIPTVSEGGACHRDQECLVPDSNCVGQTCPGVCRQTGHLGQPCYVSYLCFYGEGYCNSTGICAPKFADGANCQSDNECDSLLCSLGQCQPLPGAGQPCRSGRCREDASCNSANNTCETAKTIGQSCNSPYECAFGMACAAGKCAVPLDAGAFCRNYDECDSRKGYDCDLDSRCSRQRLFSLGERCNFRGSTCSLGAACRNAALPDGGLRPGVCGYPLEGDVCTYDGHCPDFFSCVSGKCLATPPNGACTGNCPLGQYCTGSPLRCARQLDAGANCTTNPVYGCTGGMICGSANSTCRLPPGDGQACDNGTCAWGSDCISGTCQKTGGFNQLCGRTLYTCFAGSCTNNVCGAPKANGSYCFYSSDCASGVCRAGRCDSTCG